jgi:hypothetical protein
MRSIYKAAAAISALAFAGSVGFMAVATTASAEADGWQVVDSGNVEFVANTTGSAQATCPSGKKVVGGGFENSEEHPKMLPTMSRELNDSTGRTWIVRFYNTDTVSSHYGHAYAVCINA